ncbi:MULTISPECIES: YnbE family lipoprotein [Proteus]|uniref:YnbE family lipoprotein n=4 Tax=Proteus TaxID=583 RepID=A0A6I7D190_9GAMM|nr:MULTISPECIES: YnbE family lipoprotein [Proteus]MBG2801191.1 YnbE family lipoprotein [Proteus mirabilis]MBI6337470.1 YnbE family lipoprotein [Proteus sp. PR00224]MBI6405201.1 YnbE family lipoprotein [Proteus sp. PR00208]MBG3018849.1 YnbE family lipoprotein [Proteus mirabilis]MBG3128435.1 YnbE family lipoprotein [Proteus mirabilis]
MKPLFLRKLFLLTALMMGISALTGCIRLEVATPDKPININMNVKIEHEINVKIDRQVEDLLKNNSAIF